MDILDNLANFVKDIVKAETKRENGIDFPASDFAYVPEDDMPSTWKLRLTEEPGVFTIAQLGLAAAALSPGGVRGNMVEIPESAMDEVKRKIRDEYARLGVEVEDIPNSVKEIGFSIKKIDGKYRFTAIYSNNFRDVEKEIIAEKSHQKFIELVDKEEIPYPELWYWHNKDWKIGQADFLAYDDKGFSVASGFIDNKEIAKAMIENKELCNAVSHGMFVISREKENEDVIIEHITYEISPLPFEAAANKLTGFIINDSEAKMIDEKKLEAAKKLGIDIDIIESDIDKKAKLAQEMELDSKEIENQEFGHEKAEEVKETEPTQGEKQIDIEFELKEFADGVAEAIKQLNQKIDSIEEKLIAKKDEQILSKELTPGASIANYFKSAIREETRIDGRTKLANDMPEETKEISYTKSTGTILDHIK